MTIKESEAFISKMLTYARKKIEKDPDLTPADREKLLKEFDLKFGSGITEPVATDKTMTGKDDYLLGVTEMKVFASKDAFIKDLKETVELDGTLSHGTMRASHLIPVFMQAIAALDPKKAAVLKAAMPSEQEIAEETEATMGFVNELFDVLDSFAPKGKYFGAHPGDGSDYGYWPTDEIE